MVKSKLEQAVIDAVEAAAADRGIDVVDVDVTGATKAPVVRVRIDWADGRPITLDEVSANTGWVSDAIDALDPIKGSFTLEVSSPGMARPLRRPADVVAHIGEAVEVTTAAPTGRRSYKGVLTSADDAGMTLAPEGEEPVTLAYDEVKKCTLSPVYDFKGGVGKAASGNASDDAGTPAKEGK